MHDHWDWSVRIPVLMLDFSHGRFAEPEDLDAYVAEQLAAAEARIGLRAEHHAVTERLASLLQALHERAGQRVAVLIDEYDKPILDAMKSADAARANRNWLRNLFAVIGSSDAHVGFTFLTGVSRFSKVDPFSGFDGFEDITDNVYLFEFKVVELAGEGAAMARLRGRGYAGKYRYVNRPIHLVAVEFSKETRRVVSFEVARAGP